MTRKDDRGIDIIKRLLGDEEKITFNNKSIKMKEFRELESKYIANENKLKSVVVFWDDLIQYTTIGLIDCILDDQKDIIDKEYDYNLFFYRPNEQSDHIEFIIELFRTRFSKTLTKEYINSIYSSRYAEILLKSPASSFIFSIIRCESLYNKILFCFRNEFDGIMNFVKSIGSRFTGKYTIELQCAVLEDSDDEVGFLTKYGNNYDIFMMQRLDRGIEWIDKTKLTNKSFVSPYGCNGVSKDYFTAIMAVYGDCKSGPYNSEFVIFDQGISVA